MSKVRRVPYAVRGECRLPWAAGNLYLLVLWAGLGLHPSHADEQPPETSLSRLAFRVLDVGGAPLKSFEYSVAFYSAGAEKPTVRADVPHRSEDDVLRIPAPYPPFGRIRIWIEADDLKQGYRIGYAAFSYRIDRDKPAEPATIQLQPGIVLTGTVLDATTGKPIAGADVAPLKWGHHFNWADWDESSKTDAKGNYRVVTGSAKGIAARHPRYRTGEVESAGQQHTFRLDPLLTVRGRVVDADGKPIAGASIGQSENISDKEGRFGMQVTRRELAHPQDSEVSIFAEGYRYQQVPLAKFLFDRETVVTLEEEQLIGGQVLDADGNPPKSCRIELKCEAKYIGSEFRTVPHVRLQLAQRTLDEGDHDPGPGTEARSHRPARGGPSARARQGRGLPPRNRQSLRQRLWIRLLRRARLQQRRRLLLPLELHDRRGGAVPDRSLPAREICPAVERQGLRIRGLRSGGLDARPFGKGDRFATLRAGRRPTGRQLHRGRRLVARHLRRGVGAAVDTKVIAKYADPKTGEVPFIEDKSERVRAQVPEMVCQLETLDETATHWPIYDARFRFSPANLTKDNPRDIVIPNVTPGRWRLTLIASYDSVYSSREKLLTRDFAYVEDMAPLEIELPPSGLSGTFDNFGRSVWGQVTIEAVPQEPGLPTRSCRGQVSFRFMGLAPGTYSLRFSGDGCKPKRIDNVVVQKGKMTWLDNVVLESARPGKRVNPPGETVAP